MPTQFNPRPLGRSNLIVPNVCLGTMTFGEQTSEQDAHSSYDNVLLADRSFQNIGKMVVPSLRRLPPEQREQLTNMLVHTLGQIQGEVSRCL